MQMQNKNDAENSWILNWIESKTILILFDFVVEDANVFELGKKEYTLYIDLYINFPTDRLGCSPYL